MTVAGRVSTNCSYHQHGKLLTLLLTSVNTECIDTHAAVLTSALSFYSRRMLIRACTLNNS